VAMKFQRCSETYLIQDVFPRISNLCVSESFGNHTRAIPHSMIQDVHYMTPRNVVVRAEVFWTSPLFKHARSVVI